MNKKLKNKHHFTINKADKQYIVNPTIMPPSPQCKLAVQFDEQTVLLDSGRSISSMGLFDECIKQPLMNYGLVTFISNVTKAPVGLWMGTCIPQNCTSTDIEELADTALEQAGLPFLGIYKQSPQEFYPSFNAAFFITVVLLGICVLFTAASSILQALKKNPIVGAFNLKKTLLIFQYKEHKFNVFNGIKSFCMMWVILGHMFSVRVLNNVNQLYIQRHIQGSFFLWVLASFFAVDVFFYIGGFLVAYSFLRNKMKSWVKYPLAVVHRVLRFWPSYIAAMLIYYGIFIHLGSGPIWFKVETAGQIDNCSAMWKPIFFMDNIIDNGESMCMGWGWYLQNDMQIFIASIPILYLYNTKRKAAFICIGVVMLLSSIANFLQVQFNEYVVVAHRVDFAKWNQYFPNVYIKPWIRCPPYLYGLALGLLYMEFIDEQKNPKESKGFFMRIKQSMEANRKVKNISQLVGLFIVLFIIYVPRFLQLGYKWPQVAHSLYLTTTKLFFVIGVSLLVTPSLLGLKNDLVFFITDTKFFHYIGKVSFWTYLIHYMFVLLVNYQQRVDFYYDVRNIFSLYVPVVIMSIFGGAIGTILIEVPFAKLEGLLFRRPKTQEEADKISKNMKLDPSMSILTDSILGQKEQAAPTDTLITQNEQ